MNTTVCSWRPVPQLFLSYKHFLIMKKSKKSYKKLAIKKLNERKNNAAFNSNLKKGTNYEEK